MNGEGNITCPVRTHNATSGGKVLSLVLPNTVVRMMPPSRWQLPLQSKIEAGPHSFSHRQLEQFDRDRLAQVGVDSSQRHFHLQRAQLQVAHLPAY